MAVTQEEFDHWVAHAKKIGATHIISVCDTFDYEDYPVYVMPNQKLEEIRQKFERASMQRINEIVDIQKESA